MATNKAALTECLELSRKISKLGLGINSKRAAWELYHQLVESSTNLGAYITAADYVPMRTQRSDTAVDAMKEISKVIYILNVANESGFFIKSAVEDAIASAVKISEHLIGVSSTYNGTAESQAESDGLDDEASNDPDGFNEPYIV
ncbi:MAG: hypothetical protein LUI60_01540 [Clostridia bacterium]|nr:hypothetical protein [Clostridia bacterium]